MTRMLRPNVTNCLTSNTLTIATILGASKMNPRLDATLQSRYRGVVGVYSICCLPLSFLFILWGPVDLITLAAVLLCV